MYRVDHGDLSCRYSDSHSHSCYRDSSSRIVLPTLLLLSVILLRVVIPRDRIAVKTPTHKFSVHRNSVVEVSIADLGRVGFMLMQKI